MLKLATATLKHYPLSKRVNFVRALPSLCQWTGLQIPMILELAENSLSGLGPQSHKECCEDMESYLSGQKSRFKVKHL